MAVWCLLLTASALAQGSASQVGREVAVPVHLQDGDEFNIPVAQLIDYGRQLITARFTVQEGAGRPMSKGTGAPISDPSSSLFYDSEPATQKGEEIAVSK